MTGERRDSDEPDRAPKDPGTDIDAAFAEIVAGWDHEQGRPDWPDTEGDEPPVVAEASALVDSVDDDEHFVPPEPPPLPRPQPQTIGAIVLFGIGLVLLVTPGLLGFSVQAGLVLGLLAISGGIVWLIARLRQGPPTDSGWDDGAQI